MRCGASPESFLGRAVTAAPRSVEGSGIVSGTLIH